MAKSKARNGRTKAKPRAKKPVARVKEAASAREYIDALPEGRRKEIKAIDALIRRTLPEQKPIFLAGILGYGPFRYKYPSGREGDWFRVGLASRASYISIYACAADDRGYVAERYREKLPRAKIGKSCVTFKRLADLDEETLVQLLRETVRTGFGM